jgi:hypothetical protein
MQHNQQSQRPLSKIRAALLGLWGGNPTSSTVLLQNPVPEVKRERSVFSDESAEVGEPPTKRPRRARVACVPCSKLKQRCDDRRPCSRCVRKGKGAECVDFEPPKAIQQDKKPALRTDFSHLMADFLVKQLTPQLIHDLVVERPFMW